MTFTDLLIYTTRHGVALVEATAIIGGMAGTFGGALVCAFRKRIGPPPDDTPKPPTAPPRAASAARRKRRKPSPPRDKPPEDAP